LQPNSKKKKADEKTLADTKKMLSTVDVKSKDSMAKLEVHMKSQGMTPVQWKGFEANLKKGGAKKLLNNLDVAKRIQEKKAEKKAAEDTKKMLKTLNVNSKDDMSKLEVHMKGQGMTAVEWTAYEANLKKGGAKRLLRNISVATKLHKKKAGEKVLADTKKMLASVNVKSKEDMAKLEVHMKAQGVTAAQWKGLEAKLRTGGAKKMLAKLKVSEKLNNKKAGKKAVKEFNKLLKSTNVNDAASMDKLKVFMLSQGLNAAQWTEMEAKLKKRGTESLLSTVKVAVKLQKRKSDKKRVKKLNELLKKTDIKSADSMAKLQAHLKAQGMTEVQWKLIEANLKKNGTESMLSKVKVHVKAQRKKDNKKRDKKLRELIKKTDVKSKSHMQKLGVFMKSNGMSKLQWKNMKANLQKSGTESFRKNIKAAVKLQKVKESKKAIKKIERVLEKIDLHSKKDMKKLEKLMRAKGMTKKQWKHFEKELKKNGKDSVLKSIKEEKKNISMKINKKKTMIKSLNKMDHSKEGSKGFKHQEPTRRQESRFSRIGGAVNRSFVPPASLRKQ